MRRLIWIITFLAIAGLSMAVELKVGFVYVGTIDDGGWTEMHDRGRLHLEETFGNSIETNYIESITEGEQDIEILESFAERGYRLIFSTSFGFMDDVIQVASLFSDTVFMHCSGYKTAPNVGTYFGRIYEPGYLTGLIAGSMTKSDIIGYVATFNIPEVIRGINAFALGVEKANPGARVHVIWTRTWFDPSLEREAAVALLDLGADVIAQSQDSPAAIQAAGERGAYAIGYNSDMRAFNPDTYLASPVWNWGPFYERVVNEVMNGTWKSYQYWGGTAEGTVEIVMSELVPAEIRARVLKEREMIIKDDLHPFEGPLYDQKGTLRYDSGEIPDDSALLSMDWFVRNVVGNP